MALTHIDLQTPEKMKKAIDINQAKELSIHIDFNFFWKFNDFNIYEVTFSDQMHLLDLGIIKLSEIPRYPGLIILKNSLENVSKFTANDYRSIMKGTALETLGELGLSKWFKETRHLPGTGFQLKEGAFLNWILAWTMKGKLGVEIGTEFQLEGDVLPGPGFQLKNVFLNLDFDLDYERDAFLDLDFNLDHERSLSGPVFRLKGRLPGLGFRSEVT
ncbi:hypothetical protein C1645_835307 [Glomus cerebriforme]|uniref:Uncharacterized protein n=1 Tax=Glomus cerebriforme TaxID=658196 RepID=A0A397SI56_9GLOM|nr:hypothetical protein C1645_835307 [Glomus cerebriforme]